MSDLPTTDTGAQCLEVHYQLTAEDIVQVTLQVYHRLRWKHRLMLAAACAGVMLLLTSPIVYRGRFEPLSLLVPAVIFVVTLIASSPGKMRKRLRERVAKEFNDVWLTPGVARVDDSGLHMQSQYFTLHYTWLAILKVEQTADYVLFYLHTRSPHTLPRRCFESPAAADAFFELARHYCPHEARCPKCNYDLRGNRTGICPECGHTAQAAPGQM